MPTDMLIVSIIAIVNAVWYTCRRLEIFDWNPELEYKTKDKTKESKFKDRRKIKYPLEWRINNGVHMFFGVLAGWALLWVLYDKRLKLLLGDPKHFQLQWFDFALFILGYVGIKGRLPTIADSVQEWFRR